MKNEQKGLPKGSAEKIERVSGVMSALSNTQRLRILCHLIEDTELSVGKLGERMDLSQSALSQHLAKLRSEGIVASRKDGLQVIYWIEREDIKEIMHLLHRLYC